MKITFQTSYRKNEGLAINPSEFINLYLNGVSLKTRDGKEIASETLRQHIMSAQNELEKLLNIKLQIQVFEETIDFDMNNFKSWGFIKTSYLVRDVIGLNGYIGTIRQISYPLMWISKSTSTDEELCTRNIHIVPSGGAGGVRVSGSVIFSGITPHLGFGGMQNIPNYWTVSYITGFKFLPEVLVTFIGKNAAIQILTILADNVFGAGISSYSFGVDGLSQSVSTNNSGGKNIYSARIDLYKEDLIRMTANLKDFYRGLTIAVC